MALLFDPMTLFTLGILVGALAWRRSRPFAQFLWSARFVLRRYSPDSGLH